MRQFSISELRYAKNYPFSSAAKRIVRESGFSLGDLPEQIVERSKSMVAAAFSEQEYNPRIENSAELLVNEVLAVPTAKIIVSIINRLELYRKFSQLIVDSVYSSAIGEKDETLLKLAFELGMKFYLPETGLNFAGLSLADYLRADFNNASMKLVNQKVVSGRVLLSRNEFARLVSLVAGQEIRKSLPVPLKNIPEKFAGAAKQLEAEFTATVRKNFSRADFGKVEPESFPPCMSKIYSELLAGIKAGHSARFAFATFLHSIGVDQEKIVDMYRATPNFNEKVTRYQVERIVGKSGKGYSSPSCDKMRSYNLCVANCPVVHPVQFYRREVFRNDAEKKNVVEEVQEQGSD